MEEIEKERAEWAAAEAKYQETIQNLTQQLSKSTQSKQSDNQKLQSIYSQQIKTLEKGQTKLKTQNNSLKAEITKLQQQQIETQ